MIDGGMILQGIAIGLFLLIIVLLGYYFQKRKEQKQKIKETDKSLSNEITTRVGNAPKPEIVEDDQSSYY